MEELRKIDEFTWKVEKSGRMKVPVYIFATERLIQKMRQDRTIWQAKNVASIQGVQKAVFVMPDGHEGYGMPIGGVAAFEYSENGIIGPGMIGYDINCGVRVIRTDFLFEDIKGRIKQLADTIFKLVPSGVGSTGPLRLSEAELDRVLDEGCEYILERGMAWDEDLKHCEEGGRMESADSSKVSSKAKRRGRPQLGTLGAGNHFLEIQRVQEIYDLKIAEKLGIFKDQVVIMIHTGSRGLGHQVASDYIELFRRRFRDILRHSPDPELVYAPLGTKEADDYFAAMSAAANYAWSNRQVITYRTRQAFEKVFGMKAEDMGMYLIYDVAHNIGKIEVHKVNGEKKKVLVHRKGATRAFPPGRPEIPEDYREIGQPVLIPGSMGTASYILVGTQRAMELCFGSTTHGSGRTMSRAKAKRTYWGRDIVRMLESRGIYVRAASMAVVAEEAPAAYKDVDEVVKAAHGVGISKKIARMVPLAVVKG